MKDLKIISQHAATVLIGQLAVMAFGVADTVIAGRYSDTALAALSVGSALYVSIFISLMGIVQALLPIWAEMLGARQHEAIGRSLRQSLYLCGFITLTGMTVLLMSGSLLQWTQVPEMLRDEVQHYLSVLAFAFAPSILFRLYSTFNQSLGKPWLVTGLQLGALMVKIPLSIWLVAGGGGIEPMGAVGCAWATLIVNYLLLLLALLMLRTQALYKPYRLWQSLEKPDWAQMGRFARLGIPGGMAYLVEVTSFTLIALFVARLGITVSASHQIAASVAALLYMMPLSLSIACSARVSFWLGAGRPEDAKRVVLIGLKLAVIVALALSATVLTANQLIASFYTNNPAIVALGSSLLVWVAVYHWGDAVQILCAFLLRSYRITLVPLALYSLLLWGLGLYGGYQLTYVGVAGRIPTQSASSFWVASTLAIGLVAISLIALLCRAVQKSLLLHPEKTIR